MLDQHVEKEQLVDMREVQMEFKVGDKVIHPKYGAGTIVSLEAKQAFGQDDEYFVIHIPDKRLNVMVPVEKASESGLRHVSRGDQLDRIWQTLRARSQDLSKNWKSRKQRISDNLKSGDVLQIAQDISDLTGLQQERRLSYTDRTLLDKGKQLVASEVALAKGLELDEAMKRIQSCLQPNSRS